MVGKRRIRLADDAEDVTDVSERRRLPAAVPDGALDPQRLPMVGQRRIRLADVAEDVADVTERGRFPRSVPYGALDRQRLPIVGQRRIRLADVAEDVADVGERRRLPRAVSDGALDPQRLPMVSQRRIRLADVAEDGTDVAERRRQFAAHTSLVIHCDRLAQEVHRLTAFRSRTARQRVGARHQVPGVSEQRRAVGSRRRSLRTQRSMRGGISVQDDHESGRNQNERRRAGIVSHRSPPFSDEREYSSRPTLAGTAGDPQPLSLLRHLGAILARHRLHLSPRGADVPRSDGRQLLNLLLGPNVITPRCSV